MTMYVINNVAEAKLLPLDTLLHDREGKAVLVVVGQTRHGHDFLRVDEGKRCALPFSADLLPLTVAYLPAWDSRRAVERAWEIYQEYLDWIRDTPEPERFPRDSDGNHDLDAIPALIPDAICHATLDTVRQLTKQIPHLDLLFHVYGSLCREFSKGWRCSVCANEDDPTYDHGRNC